MAELPRTQDIPRTDDGFDPARVEEAFAEFGDRVRELESVAAELRAELRALRSERPFRAPLEEDWPVEPYDGPPADWIAAIPPPLARAFAVPRLALEAAFLLLVALLAGLADLSARWIVLVMVAAWALVAVSEWSAAAKRARWRLDELPPAVGGDGVDAGESTGPWDMPVVQATVVEPADVSDARTVIAKLPPPAAAVEPEVEPPVLPEPEPEPAGGRRRRFLRRRAAAAQVDETGEILAAPAAADVEVLAASDVEETEPAASAAEEPDADEGTDADGEPDADEESEAEAEAAAAEPDAEADAPETEAAETEAEVAEAEPEVAEPEPGVAEPEPESEAEADADPEADAEPDAAAASEHDAR